MLNVRGWLLLSVGSSEATSFMVVFPMCDSKGIGHGDEVQHSCSPQRPVSAATVVSSDEFSSSDGILASLVEVKKVRL